MAYNREKDQRVTFDMPKHVFKQVEKLAKNDKRSVAAMMRILVVAGIEKEGEK